MVCASSHRATIRRSPSAMQYRRALPSVSKAEKAASRKEGLEVLCSEYKHFAGAADWPSG